MAWYPKALRNHLLQYWFIINWTIINNNYSSPPGQNGGHFADDILRCIFVNKNVCIMLKISLKFVLSEANRQHPSIGLDNGLAPNRRQAINWTNADPIHWRIYAALGGDELMESTSQYNNVLSRKCIWYCRPEHVGHFMGLRALKRTDGSCSGTKRLAITRTPERGSQIPVAQTLFMITVCNT